MDVSGRSAIVTGGGTGIGAALARALVARGARVAVADRDAAAMRVADELAGPSGDRAIGVHADASRSADIAALIERTENELGPVSLYFANAGISGPVGLGDEAGWDEVIDVNLRGHVRAAQVLVPLWLDRGEGYFVSTASAAGLLTQIGAAGYSATKHAAVAFAEWLAITYGDAGIRVSCLCPMGVATDMLASGIDSDDQLTATGAAAVVSAGDVLEPDDVAAEVLRAVADERFLILPHEDVLRMFRQKGSDYDRWLRGMRRYQASLLEESMRSDR